LKHRKNKITTSNVIWLQHYLNHTRNIEPECVHKQEYGGDFCESSTHLNHIAIKIHLTPSNLEQD